MKEFHVNEYLSLKVEEGITIIYVKGKKIRQCKFLLVELPVNEMTPLNEMMSIDEVTDKLNNQLEKPKEEKISIPIETEFWGHCSNLQVWAENDYNASLLHRNLAFPILKELVVAGDQLAKKAFKKEIITRFSSGFFPVIDYLVEEKYLDYLDLEDLDELLEKFRYDKLKKLSSKIALPLLKGLAKTEHAASIKEFKKEIQRRYDEVKSSDRDFIERKGYLNYLSDEYLTNELKSELDHYQGLTIPRSETRFLKQLDLVFDKKKNDAFDSIFQYEIKIQNNRVIKINISNSDLKTIPKSIGNLEMLEVLDLPFNRINNLPESIGLLKNLRYLNLDSNPLKCLPESIGGLKSIEKINLLTDYFPIPRSLRNLDSLKDLYIICWNSWYKDPLRIFSDLKEKGVNIHWSES
ncbi:MAG: leucine-rich repeat domain-containing protein [Promethearchaeota archaeon]